MAYIIRTKDGRTVRVSGNSVTDATETDVMGMQLPRSTALMRPKAQTSDISQQQGVSGWERFVVKNLTSSPDAAQRYLKHLGYQVRRYGSGWDFAVRKADTDPWQVVDPDGPDWQDVTDWVGDAIVGAGAVAAGALASPGIVTAGLAAGAAATALETAREGIGSLAGVPDNVDPASIATTGLLEAVAPGVLKGVGKIAGAVARGTGTFGAEIAGRLVGIRAVPGMGTSGEMFIERIKDQAKRLPSFRQAALLLRRAIKTVKQTGFAEKDEAQNILARTGATVDIRPVVESLRRYTLPVGSPEVAAGSKIAKQIQLDRTLASESGETLAKIRAYLGPAGDYGAVPAAQAEGIKEIFAAVGKFDAAIPIGNITRGIHRQASHGVRSALEKSMTAVGETRYVELMRTIRGKAKSLASLEKAVKQNDEGLTGIRATERFIAGLYGSSKESALAALKECESRFVKELFPVGQAAFRKGIPQALRGRAAGAGRGVVEQARRASLGAAFGDRGVAGILPDVHLTGNIYGPGALAVGGGLIAAGKRAAGLAVGAAASPRVLMATGRGILRGSAIAHRIATNPAVDAATKSALMTLLADEARRLSSQANSAPQDPPRKRPRMILGGQ